MKQWLWGPACLASIFLLLIVTACTTPSDSTAAKSSEVVIGGNLELTGGAGVIGVQWKEGIDLAIRNLSSRGGITVQGKKYNFKFDAQDNQSSAERAVTINQNFLSQGITYVFGPGVSPIFTAAHQPLKDKKVLNFVAATSAEAILGTPEGRYVFKTHAPDGGPDGRISNVAKYVIQKYSPKRIGILLLQDTNGELHMDTFKNLAKNAGIEVVYAEFFPPTQRDFSSYSAALRAKKPDLVFVGYLDSAVGPFMEQAVQTGFTEPVFVTVGGSLDSAKKYVDKVRFVWSVVTRSPDNAADKTMAEFRSLYQSAFSKEPGPSSFYDLSFYDSVLMLASAMQTAGTISDLDSISEKLKATDSYAGRVLDIKFDSRNLAHYTSQIGVIDGGKITYENIAASK